MQSSESSFGVCCAEQIFFISENGSSYIECSGISENPTAAQQPELICLQQTRGMPNKTARNVRDLFKLLLTINNLNY